ncbi:1-phosphofructokinase [Marmoricola sp. URHA0025 HA25]
MIITVTLNPSLDRTLQVRRLLRGEVQRAVLTHNDPGGKGVNVARALSAHGTPVVSVLLVGGSTGTALAAQLTEAGVDHVAVPGRHRTRANVSIVEPDGTTTKINEPGVALDPDELRAVTDAVIAHVSPGDWVVTAGSVAPGQDPEVYAVIGNAARAAGAHWAVDTSGPALAASLAAGPDLVKPNREELSEVLGAPLDTLTSVVDACRDLVAGTERTLLCSLGADGAVLVESGHAWYASGPRVQVENTVGAGDALLAGYLHGLTVEGTTAAGLRAGVAWATAAVATPGTGVPAPDRVRPDDVHITEAATAALNHLETA